MSVVPKVIHVSVCRFADRSALQLQWVDPLTNRKRTASAKTTSKREARAVAAKLEQELNNGLHADKAQLPWPEFIRRYQVEHGRGLAERSQEKIATTFRSVEHHVKPRRLCDLNAEAISRWVTRLREAQLSEHSIKSYLATLRGALSWAVEVDLLPKCPRLPKIQRAKGSKMMKGRALCQEEYARLLQKVPTVVGEANAEPWQFFLNALFYGGWRLGEALAMTWDDPTKIRVVNLDSPRPQVAIPASLQKSNRAQLFTMRKPFAAFVELLRSVPVNHRHGYVFDLPGQDGQETTRRIDWVSRVVSRVGKLAGVVVDVSPRGVKKFASAHDLRRSFAVRALRIVKNSFELRDVMRHKSVVTAEQYYTAVDLIDYDEDQSDAAPQNAESNKMANTSADGAEMGLPEMTQPLEIQGVA